MKKLFLLIPVLALSLLASAKEIRISSETSNIIHITIAASSTSDGDVIVLTDAGPYVNSKANSDDYTKISKSITIKADAGVSPVIKLEVPIQARDGKSGKFIGIKFDGSSLLYDRYIYIKDGDTNDNSLEFEDCEFYGSSKYIAQILSGTKAKNLVFRNCKFYNNTTNRGILIQGTIGHLGFYGCEFSGFVKDVINGYETTSHVDSCIVSDCYFHNHSRSSIYFKASSVEGQQTCDKLIVKNSTFANIEASGDYTSVIDIRPYGTSTTSAIKVEVDHCTFYNNTVINSDHANIRTAYLSDVTISNCIFAYPSAYATRATYCTGGGNINNCLTYNYTADGTKGHAYGCTVNAASSVRDPLFNDLANNKFTYAGNWSTGSISPAREAATDGSDLGDPRWYSDEILPSTNFASPYAFTGAKAVVNGSMELDGSNYIHSTTNGGNAIWKVSATRACAVQVTLNMSDATTSGHNYQVEIFDADGNSVGSLNEGNWYDNTDDKTLAGFIYLPAADDYKIVLTNSIDGSKATIKGITLSYIGGAVQNMPGTTAIADAWFSSNGTRADSKITFPNGKHDVGWVKWNVAFASAGNYNVTVNVNNTAGHNFTVALYRSESDESPISVGEGGSQYSSGSPNAIALGAMEVPAGNYIMKVTDAVAWSDAELLSVTLAYAGGGVIEFGKSTAASLLANADAIVSDDWSIEDGKITHAESKALTGWAKWNVDCQDYGNYNVTVNISSDNGHLVRVEIFENEAESAIYTLDETSSTQYHTGDQAIDLGNIVLDDREYVVKVSNTLASSHVQIASIVITYQNGAKQSIPGSLTLTDAILSEKAYIESSMLYFAPHDCGTIPDEWAKWNLSVAGAGVYQFTVNVTSPNEQKYQILIEDNGGNEVYNLVQTSSLGTGDKSFTTGMIYMESGNYTLEMRNVYPYSDGHLVSISAAAVANVLTIDENATDNTVIHNNYRNGTHTIHLIRTITSGMYNTICLPFDVSSAQLQSTFGSDVTLLEMSTASLSGDELTLEFDAATSIYRGTPYLIKTTKTVSNPVFTDVEIKEETGQATSKDGADFIGSFIKTTIDASEYNLFLGANDKLYFSNNDVTLKGMRAYFQVKDNGTGAPVRKARIVEQNKIVTELELIDGEWQDIKSANGIIKTIENGQLILIRDGKRYNVMGIRF